MPAKFSQEQYIKDAHINRSNIEEEIATVTGIIAFYAEQAALWTEATRTFKILRDNRASELYIGLKHGTIEVPVKLTDGYIEAYQKLDASYQDYDRKYAQANTQAELFSGAVFNLGRKHDSLRSLNKLNNTEYDATTSVMPTRSTTEEKLDRKARVVAAQG
jgi:hypothetical protein